MKIVFMREGKQMLSKKKKIFIVLGMAILLVITGYLNVVLNKSSTNNVTASETASADFFATYREDRTYTRNLELEYLDAIITSTSSSSDYIATATNKKLALVAQMDKELILEGLIAASGFSDAIVTVSGDNLNVMVKSDGLTSADAAKILSIIAGETSTPATNIKIIPVA